MIFIPMGLTNFKDGAISEAEKRILASFPSIRSEDGSLNLNFNNEFETWINDNIGLRSEMVIANAQMQYSIFHVLSNNSDMYLGPNGEFNYATDEILKDYQHLDLKTDEELADIAGGFQYAYDYLYEKGIQLYYFQCWDKQSIYPEQFPETVLQNGTISKTDQIVETLSTETEVNVISPKKELIAAKANYNTYSTFGDATHWTQRGAYIGYLELMKSINNNNENIFKTLNEADYDITITDQGSYLFGGIHETCMLENFQLKQENAVLTPEKLSFLSEEKSHSFYTNEQAGNNTRVLIIGDSYVNSFILDDLAESFYETIMIWGDYASDFEEIINVYRPDIVIIENAERCDRTIPYTTKFLEMKENKLP
jgi:hypothetical protein